MRLAQVTKSYGTTQALRPTTVAFADGQTTVLIGPSGCGKTTLLRLLNGLLTPDTGTIYFEDTPLTAANARTTRHRMGYVIQEGGLFPHLTARDNVALLARHLGWAAARIDARLAELAGLVQLPMDRLADYPAQLSGGQRQRVGLMRALMLDPAVLLLDEPLGALDPMIRADLQADLRRIFQQLQKTVVLVTHDLGEAAYFADTILLMRDGAIVQQGTFRDFTERPAEAFVTAFVQAQRQPAARTGGTP